LERRKYLGRVYKDYYRTVTSKIIRVDEVDLVGYAAYLQIDEVNRPFMVGEMGAEICLADNGYFEIAFLPDEENWQLSAVYDNHGDIIEWYVDITKKNAIDEEGDPYCDDLYLDAALMPDGQILIFDEDELQNALTHGNINQNEFDMAYRVLNKLFDNKILDLTYMKTLCSRLLSIF
jgi:predicted RNA-binding protein associated with RNAse of E/G family